MNKNRVCGYVSYLLDLYLSAMSLWPISGPPGIPGNAPSQKFPREFPGITEFSAGISGNFKILQI